MKNRVLFFLGVVCVLYTSLLGNGYQCLASTIEVLGEEVKEEIPETLSKDGFPSIFHYINPEAYSSENWYMTSETLN